MDDSKLFAPNDKKLAELKLVKRYSDDIQVEFGIDKHAKCTFVQSRPTKPDNIKIDTNTTIQELDNEASYEDHRVEESHQICHCKEYLWRTRLNLKTYLSPRNKIKAINQLAIPVF